jgi:hypothetical protein
VAVKGLLPPDEGGPQVPPDVFDALPGGLPGCPQQLLGVALILSAPVAGSIT